LIVMYLNSLLRRR